MDTSHLEDWIASVITEEQMRPFAGANNRSSILAAAGSGKTRTLIHLLAHDLCSGVPASGIIAFTFTEKAAQELLARIYALRNQYMATVDLSGIFVGTIHSWCLQYLASQSDFYNSTPLNELHVDALAGRLYDALELEKVYKKRFPGAIGTFLGDIEVFYNEHLRLEDVPPAIRPALSAFLGILSANRLLTFGAMIRSTTEHLDRNGPLPELQSLYVDEYQDVNPAQTALIKAMLPPHGKLRVVGDDLQSIYNWRGSDVSRILDFPEEFAPADVFRLATNHRSRPEVVSVANGVARGVALKDAGKSMESGRKKSRRKVVHWISTNSEAEQAEKIVEIVQRFHNAAVPYSRIAILLRSVTRSGRPIYEALQRQGIPVECPIITGAGAFIDEFLMPVLEWLRTEQREPRNKREEEEQEESARSLWSSVSPWVAVEDTENTFWNALNGWYDLLRSGKNNAYNVRDCLYDFLDTCGVRVAPSDTELMAGMGIASQIIRSVEEIHRRRIKGQKRRSAVGVVNEVYFALSRNRESFGESLPVIQDGGGGVVLTTVHQAKGLEWPVVCLPMMNRNFFPLPDRPSRDSFPAAISERYGTRQDDERRLFYVAVTRARERLFMLDTAARKPEARSVFLNELQRHRILPEEGLSAAQDSTWSIESEDLQSESQPPVWLSLSDLLLYLECPYQYGLRRVAGLQPAVGDELGFGEGLHELLQRRAESREAWSKEEVTDQVERNVHLPLSSEESEQNAKRAIARRITALEELGAFEGEQQQELPVEVYLDSGVVTGVIDFIHKEPDGSLVVRDWKSNVHEGFVDRYARQLQVYAHALRLQGHDVSRAELVDVAASAEKKNLVTTEVDVGQATVAQLVNNCQEALQAIRDGWFHPTPSAGACGACDVRRICAAREG